MPSDYVQVVSNHWIQMDLTDHTFFSDSPSSFKKPIMWKCYLYLPSTNAIPQNKRPINFRQSESSTHSFHSGALTSLQFHPRTPPVIVPIHLSLLFPNINRQVSTCDSHVTHSSSRNRPKRKKKKKETHRVDGAHRVMSIQWTRYFRRSSGRRERASAGARIV